MTDTLLTVVLVGGLVVAAGIGLSRTGGIGGLHAAVVGVDPALLAVGTRSSEVLGFTLAFGLSLAVAPYEVSRVYAMRDRTTVRKAIGGSLVIQAVIAVCVLILGLLARTRFPGLANPDAAVVSLITTYFGPVVGGILLFAILAAVLSTVDSVLLVSSSSLVYDFYESLPERWKTQSVDQSEGTASGPSTDAGVKSGDGSPLARAGDPPTAVPAATTPFGSISGRSLPVIRTGTVISGLVPLVLAINSGRLGGLIQLIVVLYAALVASALFVPVLLGIHRNDVPGEGIVAGMIIGTGSAFVWHVFVAAPSALTPGVSVVPPVAVGVASNAVVVAVTTLRR